MCMSALLQVCNLWVLLNLECRPRPICCMQGNNTLHAFQMTNETAICNDCAIS